MPPTDALREAMEASLKANPDDLATHMAYADHLNELGDPRGEFIQVQLALEDPSRPADERKRLGLREQELLQAHQAQWLGEAAPMFLKTRQELVAGPTGDLFGLDPNWSWHFGSEYNHFHFARGWLDSLELYVFNPRLAEALSRSPTIALLAQLVLNRSEEDNHGYDALAEWSCLGSLQSFQIGPDPNKDVCQINGWGISAAIARMSRLEELYLYAHSVVVGDVFALPMPNLRTLHVYHLHDYPLHILADNASLGNLITLCCWPHAQEPGDTDAYLQPAAFEALVRSPHLKSLMHLALYLTDIGDESMAALVESGLLKRLRVLDLWNSRISDEGARILAACPDLRHLEKLRLSNNQLTSVGIGVLAATGVNLEAANQWTATALEENQHLWEGDME
jgi:uncharacterized protein (TIGR02996 family)